MLLEQVRGELRLVAEGYVALDAKLDRRFGELDAKIDRNYDELLVLIRENKKDADMKFATIDVRFASVDAKLSTLDAKIDATAVEMRFGFSTLERAIQSLAADFRTHTESHSHGASG